MKDEGHVFFVDILADPQVAVEAKVVPAFILSALMDNFSGAQEKLRHYRYLDVAVGLLRDWDGQSDRGGMLHMWLLIGIGRLWAGYKEARSLFLRNMDLSLLTTFSAHPLPEVRAAAAFALGTLSAGHSDGAASASQMDVAVAQALVQAAADEGSPLVRRQILVGLSTFLGDYEGQFARLASRLLKERERLPTGGTEMLEDMLALLSAQLSRSVYESVWLTFLRLAGDPFWEVSAMARRVVERVRRLAERIFVRQAALQAEIANRQSSGEGSPRRGTPSRETSREASEEATGPREPLLSTEFLAWSSKRWTQPLLGRVREGGSGTSAGSGTSGGSAGRGVWDLSPLRSSSGRLSDWATATLGSLVAQAAVEREGVEDRSSRVESQRWVQRLEEEAGVVELAPLAPHVALAFPNSGLVELWDWESAARKARFRNSPSNAERLSWLRLINPLTHSFLMTGSVEGSVRVWDLGLAAGQQEWAELEREEWDGPETTLPSTSGERWERLRGSTSLPRLVTAWRVWDWEKETNSGGWVYRWEEDSGLLVVGGGSSVRLWDARM